MGQEMTLTYGAFLKEHLKCLVVFCLFFVRNKEEGKEGGWEGRERDNWSSSSSNSTNPIMWFPHSWPQSSLHPKGPTKIPSH